MTDKEFTDAAISLRQTVMARARAFPLDSADVEDIAQDTLLKLWALRGDIPSADRACRLSVVGRHRQASGHRPAAVAPHRAAC